MRAACCEATVLSHESILPDIRLLRALWPDREHAPHAGQFFTLRAWGADEAPFLSRPISVHKWEPETQTIEFLYQVCLLYTSPSPRDISGSRMPSSA